MILSNLEIPDHQLFEDTTASSLKTRNVSLREQRKLKAKEPSKCFISLENTSKVQDPISKRNRVRTPYERKHPAIKAKLERNKELGIIPHRELQSLTDRIAAGKKVKQSKEEVFDFQKDLWAEELPKNPVLDSEWINENVKLHHLKNTGEDKVKIPQIAHETRSKLKAIDTVPGTSYNPHKVDYEKLIDTVVQKEEEVIKKQQKLNRALKPLFQKITKSESKRRRREEMRQGFPLNSDDENESEDASDNEYKPLNPPVRNKKKDLKKRRKQKEHKLREAERELEKQELKKLNDLGMLKMYKKQIVKQEIVLEKKLEKHKKELKLKKVQPRRLARRKFEDEEIQVEDAPEALGNLRKIKPLGNILVDRFKSLQKRNIIAPTVRRLPRKLRLTKVKKNSHKEQIDAPARKKKGTSKLLIHD